MWAASISTVTCGSTPARNPLPASGRRADDEVAERQRLPRHLPRVHLTDDAAPASCRVDDAKPQRVDSGVDDDAAEKIERLVAGRGHRFERALFGVVAGNAVVVGHEQVADRELALRGTRLSDLRRHHQAHLVAPRVVMRERGDPQRQPRHGKRRQQCVAQAVVRRLRRVRGRRQHERLARADRHVAPPHVHVDAMPVALAILRPLLDAEQIVGGNLGAEPLEDRVAGPGHVEERAERHSWPGLRGPASGFGDPAFRWAAVRQSSRRRAADRAPSR